MPDAPLYVFCFARPSALREFASDAFDPGRPVEVHPLGTFAAVAATLRPGGIADLLEPGHQGRRLRELGGRSTTSCLENSPGSKTSCRGSSGASPKSPRTSGRTSVTARRKGRDYGASASAALGATSGGEEPGRT